MQITKKYDKAKSFYDDLDADDGSAQREHVNRSADQETFGAEAAHYRPADWRGGGRRRGGGGGGGNGGGRGRGRGGGGDGGRDGGRGGGRGGGGGGRGGGGRGGGGGGRGRGRQPREWRMYDYPDLQTIQQQAPQAK